jgi:hypothetical protein
MLLWASKGGPQGHPFSPSQMSLLGKGKERIDLTVMDLFDLIMFAF